MIVKKAFKYFVAVCVLLTGEEIARGASISYTSVVTSQSPLLYWRMNDTAASLTSSSGKLAVEVDNTDSTYNSGALATVSNITVGSTAGNALTPAGGFAGFEDANTWFSFPQATTVAGSVISGLSTPLGAIGTEAGSVSLWFRIPSADLKSGDINNTNIIFRGDGGTNKAIILSLDSFGHVRLVNGSLTNANLTTNTYANDNWHHLLATWSRTSTGSGALALYVDGGAAAGGETSTSSFTGWSVASPTAFSGRMQFAKGTNNASEIGGHMDEPAIWTSVLTEEQARLQYYAAFGVPEPSTLTITGLLICGITFVRRNTR